MTAAAPAMLDHALAYAEHGWPVLPLHSPIDGRCDCRPAGCDHPAKHPRTMHGLTDASTDPEAVTRWWGLWPEANIGIAVPAGFVVVDLDAPDAGTELELPETAESATGRGRHLIYRTAAEVRPRVAVSDHVDVRGPGSYIVAPPSRHISGRSYQWVRKLPEAVDAPRWLAALAEPEWTPAPPIGETIPDGRRNAVLTSLAGTMRRRGMTEAAILAALDAENMTRCRPPLPAAEVRTIARSVVRYPPEPWITLSAAPDVPSGRKQLLTFRTARDLAAELTETPDYLAFGIVRGATTELTGRAKASGKSTYLGHLCGAVLDGRPFLGQPTTYTPIVYLTEQPPASLRPLLARAGLTERDDLTLLLWKDTRGASWPDIVGAAVAECERIGATLLIVDTLPAFAGIRGDAENDAGAALQAIEPLQAAAADGLAVVVVRHERKGGGEVGDSGRGSSAFSGAVDVILRLARKEQAPRPTIRTLAALSRFDETPPEIVIELTDEGYIVLGDEASVAFAEARDAILAGLRDDDGLTMDEIVAELVAKRTTAQDAVRVLTETGVIERTGAGRRGDPYRYRRIRQTFLPAALKSGPAAESFSGGSEVGLEAEYPASAWDVSGGAA